MKYDINEFADICGYFDSNTDVNNGYGCVHKDQEMQDIDSKTNNTIGMCYAWSCPLARVTIDNCVIPHKEGIK